MKNKYLIIIIVILIVVIGVMIFYLIQNDGVNSNSSLNSNGQQDTNTAINTNSNTNSAMQSDVQVTKPVPDETVNSPLTVAGRAKGSWFFEAVFPVQIVDENDKQIGYGNAEAIGDWQTENYVDFTALLTFTKGSATAGFLVLQNANPSGIKSLEKELRIPIKFVASTISEIEIYLGKESEQSDCSTVFAVKRLIDETPQIATAAVNQLLTGPTEAEENDDYNTSISPSARLLSLNITDGKAYADFNQELQNIGGSCRVQMVRAQIENTLKQFDSVQEVFISIDGKTEGILQP
ncbi:MAG: GerMN domain-containing protein [Patescibacteria group bacterium]